MEYFLWAQEPMRVQGIKNIGAKDVLSVDVPKFVDGKYTSEIIFRVDMDLVMKV